MSETGTETTKGEGGSDNDGVADLSSRIERGLSGRDREGVRSGDVDFCDAMT